MQPPEKREITSYGLDRSVTSWVLRPERPEDVGECIAFAAAKRLRICPAGGRNSFGDVFLIGDHVSIDTRRLDRTVAFDAAAGTITVEAGVLEPTVLAQVMPLGWQLPAVSGSLWNTIAGNLSSNVNGKDAWKVGTFGDQVVSFKIVLADGSTREVDREGDPSLFEAVVGGLGLLGVVTEVTLRLRPIPSPMVECRSRSAADARELADHFARLDPRDTDFSYAWLDGYAEGRRLGRGVSESARFVPDERAFSAAELRRELVPPSRIFGLRPETFWGVVSRAWSVLFRVGCEGSVFRALGAVKHARARRAGERVRRVAFPDYQYPMAKRFPHWNLKFAPHGFNEVQALFPSGAFEAGLRAVLAVCRRRGRTPEVCAVRRHRGDRYLLSFAGDGLSVTLPFSLAGFRPGELDAFRAELMDAIAELGGRVYLSKFPYLRPAVLQRMYPRLAELRAIKQRVDPECRFWSDAAERLLA
ncbi:MAG TPA: FAD-binding oxidoreductase [Candidatus Binatia bacterium]|nr:FAD-binding oxidoreductase [Candidatus Binatia bacterium]